MKKDLFKIYMLSLASFAIVTFTGCSDDNNDDNGGNGNAQELRGVLNSGDKRTLETGKSYSLVGGFKVSDGAELIIKEGVTIEAACGDEVDFILVAQGGKITAEGTKNNPIVMTSKKKEAGAWGGVHICGKAPINLEGGTGKSEIGDATFGGNNPADNSGKLRYIRLEYTGYAFNPEKESNGFTFYGVGNGTTVEYLQAYKGADDGFEWFGGTVNAKYLVSVDSGDDSFDWTDGWNGKAQFLIAYQRNEDGDCLIEADNREGNPILTPYSHPALSNLTLIGNNSTENKRGVRLRRGTFVNLYNTLITGKPQCVTVDDTDTENGFLGGKDEQGKSSAIEYTYLSNTFVSTNELGLAGKEGNKENQTFSFTKGYIGTIDGGKDMTKIDPFFTDAQYKGAVSADNDWTEGWTKMD